MGAPDVVYRNARVFTADLRAPWATTVATEAERIVAVGDDDVVDLAGPGTDVVDAGGGLLLPGVTDAHIHTLMTGDALTRADLVHARDLGEIEDLVASWARANPSSSWVLGRGWLHSAIPDGRPTRQMLDDVVADRPACMDANDYHSVWLNSAGLRELGIDRTTPDPDGGEIVRDAEGEPTGELRETAVFVVWGHFATSRPASEHDAHLEAALRAMAAAGVTSAIDMALDRPALEAMARAERGGTLTARLRAHWLLEVHDAGSELEEAAALAAEHASDRLRVVGVKIVSDGVIDSCTAAMTKPFANGAHPPPIWPQDVLVGTVAAVDAAGLQIAIHAIGDAANRNALDAFEAAAAANGTTGRRHRIEHVEYIDPADVPRFGPLGVTASMQPVHADPAIRANWAAMLGDGRAMQGYRWADLEPATTLVFGTDAPTAPHEALPNLFVATTRRSALQPGLGAQDEQRPIDIANAFRHATIDAAWSCFDEGERGSIEAGKLADLVLLDRDPLAEGSDSLLEATVVRTVVGGRDVYEG